MLLTYVKARSIQDYHDYLRRERINPDSARFAVSRELAEAAKRDGRRVVEVSPPPWSRAAA